MADEPHQLFPDIPESFDSVDDAALQALLDESLAAKDKIVAQDPEFLGEMSAKDVLDTMRAGVDGILALKAEQAARLEATTNLASELASMAAQVEPEATLDADGDADGDDSGDDSGDAEVAAELAADTTPVEPAVEAEPVVASAEQNTPLPIRRSSLPAQGRHQAIPVAPPERGLVFRASAGVEGHSAGDVLDAHQGLNGLNLALAKAIERANASIPGMRDTPIIATADITDRVPEFRKLRNDSGDEAKVLALTAAAREHGVGYDGDDWGAAEALTASGGICAPVTPYYDLAFISEMARPVRDSLVGFVAPRGGINFATPPYLGQITTGVGVITASQDAAGGTAGTKTCQTLICPGFQVVEVESIFHCFTGGNLGQRAFPEQAAQFSSLILAQHARVADTQLLNQIKAGSANVLGQSTVLGAFSSLLNDMLTAAAAYRSNNRMARNAPLQAIVPGWTADLLLIDLLQSNFYRFEKTQAGLEDLFASFNLRVIYSLDGPTDGEGQVLARQGAGALIGFPTVVEWALFHPGAWLFVDSGVLELGIVRDSVLNATNSYQVFGESWEAAAGIGVQSLWITSNVCATGATALSIANTHQCGS